MADEHCNRVLAAAHTFQRNIMGLLKRSPKPATEKHVRRLTPTTTELERLAQADEMRGTILYLAYGSNLSVEKFRGSRGIQPLSQVNVQVPDLRLTFDLPGVPYTEPCFANSGRRDPEKDHEVIDFADESKSAEYRKDRWHKGLIGVVYEVTPEDYAHIIATEGGGSGYQDILVDCHPFASTDPEDAVPQTPRTSTFKAHTLFAPRLPEGSDPPKHGGRIGRPDPSYAQPSARYLKLITDGAAELALPYEYQEYLQSIRPYRITTMRQRAGKAVLLATWVPIVLLILALGKMFANKQGLHPPWLRELSGAVFKGVWHSYDTVFAPVFGDGERSIPDQRDRARQKPSTYGFEKSVELTEDVPLLDEVDIERVALQSTI